jgi:hypothetical protein
MISGAFGIEKHTFCHVSPTIVCDIPERHLSVRYRFWAMPPEPDVSALQGSRGHQRHLHHPSFTAKSGMFSSQSHNRIDERARVPDSARAAAAWLSIPTLSAS